MSGKNDSAVLRSALRLSGRYCRLALELECEVSKQKEQVQRQFELRRLEWNRAEGLQAQVNELQKKVAQLERAAAEQGSPK